jgi:hypothetical protein
LANAVNLYVEKYILNLYSGTRIVEEVSAAFQCSSRQSESSCQVSSLPTSVVMCVHAIGRRIPIVAILSRPHRAIGRRSVYILKILKVHYTSLVILIPGYKTYIFCKTVAR